MATPHEHGGGCCADHDHSEAELEMMNDPTLASCCERDQRQYDKAMELKRVLTLHDPTSGGVRLRQQLFEPTAHDAAIAHKQHSHARSQQALAPLQSEKERREEQDADDDSDFDDSDLELDDMDEVFAARRKELEAQFQVALHNAADGYGVVAETNFSALLHELRATPEVPRVVLVSNSQVDALRARELVREMGAVAKKFLGTKFSLVSVRGNGSDEVDGSKASASDSVSARDLRLKTVPCVVAFRNGEQVDSAPLDAKSNVDAATLWEARLVPWLGMCNVLAMSRQDRSAAANGGGRTQGKRAQQEQTDDAPAYDCGVENCRIRFGFEHEHVGPSQESRGEISAWRN